MFSRAFPFKKDAFSAADLDSYIHSCFDHVCGLEKRHALAFDPLISARPGVDNVVGAVQSGDLAAFQRDFGRTAWLLKLQVDDYKLGDSLSDFIGDTERQRLSVSVHDKPSIMEAWNDPNFQRQVLSHVRKTHPQRIDNPLILAYEMREAIYSLSYRYGGEAAQFGTIKARCILTTVIDMLPQPANSVVVMDTSAGWGDRALAAGSLAPVSGYVGFDPNSHMHGSYGLIKSLVTLTRKRLGMPPITMKFVADGFPLAVENVQQPTVDVVFTSPPYWNKEVYSRDPGQSTSSFGNFEAWWQGFFLDMMGYSASHLRRNGIMAIHISDVGFDSFTIVERMCRWCVSNGLAYVGVIALAAPPKYVNRPTWIFKKL